MPYIWVCIYLLLYIYIYTHTLKVVSIESVMPSNHLILILCHPLLLLLSISLSVRDFSNESALYIPKYWSFSFNNSSSNEFSRLISFRNNGFDLLAVQRILKRLCQNHSSKASVLQYSAFFMVQRSHPSTTIGKAIALIIWTFVGNVMSLLLNMLSMFVIAFLPKSLDFVCWVCFHCHNAIDWVV